MANSFLTPDIIARQAYANLYEQTVMAQLVHRDYSSDFRGAVGSTVSIRKPAIFESDEYDRGSGLNVQDATESQETVTLDTILDVSFAVTAEDLTLEIAEFNRQLLQPATEAIRQGIDRKILTLRDDVTQEQGGSGDEFAWDNPRVLIEAGRVLDENNVPDTDRHAVQGARGKAAFVSDALLHEADKRGDTDGLRRAFVGDLFDFDTYMTQNVKVPDPQGSGISTTEVGVAFHRSAFALVSRALALPRGNRNAEVFGDEGFGIRVVQDYDIDQKQDVISLDILIGVKTLDADRAVLVKGDDGS